MKAKELVLCALFATLTAAGAFIRIPVPYVPFTLQFFFCATAGIFLGAKAGAVSQAVYVFIGLIGVPVFTKGGGFGYVLEPTFGYLLGFILCAGVTGRLTERMREMKFFKLFLSVLAGMFLMYLLGVPYLYFIYNLYIKETKDIWWAVYYGFIIFLPGDVFLSAIAAFTAKKLIPVLRKNSLAVYKDKKIQHYAKKHDLE